MTISRPRPGGSATLMDGLEVVVIILASVVGLDAWADERTVGPATV